MAEWFECKIKYERTMDNGVVKKVNEPYLVDALNFTEAERRITEEIAPFMTGEFQVSDIKRARYAEIFETTDESADRWFKAKLTFVTLDEKSGKENESCRWKRRRKEKGKRKRKEKRESQGNGERKKERK